MKKKIGEYVLEEKIGSGAFGEVYRATNVTTKEVFAIKMLNRTKMSSKVRSYLDREIEIIQKVNDDNVVKLKDLKVTENNYYLIFEYCNGGDLAGYRRNKGGRVEEPAARRILKQTVKALEALYTLGGIHRDIKLGNILLHYPTEPDRQADAPVAKLADFGFARFTGQQGQEEAPVEMSIVGTPLNMSPELFLRQPYTTKSDIWSLGTVAFELLCGHPAFLGANKEHLFKVIESGEYKIPKDAKLSTETIDFVTACIQYNPHDRISGKQLLTHPFISGNTWAPFDFKAFREANPAAAMGEDRNSIILTSRTKYSFGSLYKQQAQIPPTMTTVAKVEITVAGETLGKVKDESATGVPESSCPDPEKNKPAEKKEKEEAKTKTNQKAPRRAGRKKGKRAPAPVPQSDAKTAADEKSGAEAKPEPPAEVRQQSAPGMVFVDVAHDFVKVDEKNEDAEEETDDKLKSEYVLL